MMKNILLIGAGLLLALILYLLWANRAVETTEYSFKSRKVDEAFDGFRIVQVSDLQSEYFGKNQEKLLAAVAAADPDIIVFTGDLLDRNHTDYEASLTAAEGLVQIAPVYYVNGNHELALPVAEVAEMYEKLQEMGVTLLFDEGVSIERNGSRLYLAGLSEETLYTAKTGADLTAETDEEGRNAGRGKVSDTDVDASVIEDAMERAFAGAAADQLQVLLVHEPQFLQIYGRGSADLIFAGHAHGGQIRLPFTEGLFAPGQGFLPKLTSGKHRSGNAEMIISRGLGNSVFPLRVFNRPEVVVTELRR